MDCDRFSLSEKKRYAKNIRIGMTHTDHQSLRPYGLQIGDPMNIRFFLFIIIKLIINNLVIFFNNFGNITLLKNEYTND